MLAGGASPDTDMTSLTVLSPSRVEILNVHLVSNRRQLTGMSCCFNFCHTNMCHLSHDTVVHSTKSIFFCLFEFCEKWWCWSLIIWFLFQTFKKYDSIVTFSIVGKIRAEYLYIFNFFWQSTLCKLCMIIFNLVKPWRIVELNFCYM